MTQNKVLIYIAECKHKLREEGLLRLIELSGNSNYVITKDPANADIILVAEPYSTYCNQPHLLRKYFNKCFALDFSDRPYLIIPGLYASLTKSFWQKYYYRSCPYLFDLYGVKGGYTNSFVDNIDNSINLEKKYLFSFVGGSTSWVRKRLFRENFQNRDDILIYNTTSDYDNWNSRKTNRDREEMQKNFVDVIRRSKFVLCPMGVGKGSIRLFEVMKLGVAPVIISDHWLLPQGPDWNSFALFVKASEIGKLPKLIEPYADEFQVRGYLARKAWDDYFAPPLIFGYCINTIEDLRRKRISFLNKLILESFPIFLFLRTIKETVRNYLKQIILFVISFRQ
jgi:hypothetical protein